MQINEHFPLRGIDYSALAATADRVVYIREKDTPIFPSPCECTDCQDQFYFSSEHNMPQFAYTRKISDAEAKKILGDFVAGICSDRLVIFVEAVSLTWRYHHESLEEEKQG